MKENLTRRKRHPSSFTFYLLPFIFCFCFAFLAGCVDPVAPAGNTIDTNPPPNTENYGDDDDWEIIEEPETKTDETYIPPWVGSDLQEEDTIPLRDRIIFTDPGSNSSLTSGQVSQNTVVTTITFPETGDNWTAALVPGTGDTDNDLFTIISTDPPAQASLVFKEEVTLVPTLYSARIRISNGNGFTGCKIISFEITLSPPAFTEAPKVYPKVDGQSKNYLDIRWNKRSTATSYTAYVGTTSVFGEAVAVAATSDQIAAGSLTVNAFPPTGGGDLPDNTRYWVWTTAANNLGTTPPSPAANKKTTAPVQEFFWKPNEEEVVPLFDCHAGDFYRFTAKAIKYWFGPEHYIGDVVYHEIHDPPSDTSNSPFPDTLKDKTNCIGLDAGVFIIKYRDDHVSGWLKGNDKTGQKRYSAVYYWGVGAVKSGKTKAGIVNQWAGYAETVTLEEAMDKFTCANIATYLHLVPEPYEKTFNTANTNTTYGGEPLYGQEW